MAETWNLDRLEGLLEQMEPDEIRARYGAELAAHPQCLAMLDAFEGLDERLQQLKESVPPAPALAVATRPVPLLFSVPQAPRPAFPRWRWTRWALPVAALLVVGLLLVTRAPQSALEQTAVAPPEALKTLPAAEPLAPSVSQDAELVAEDTADLAASQVQPPVPEASAEAPEKETASAPASARPTLRRQEESKMDSEVRRYEEKPTPAPPPASQELPAQVQATEAPALAPAKVEKRAESAREADDRLADALVPGASQTAAPNLSEEKLKSPPRGRRLSSIMNLAPGGAASVDMWVEKYNALRKDPGARAELFTPGLDPFRGNLAGTWPRLLLHIAADGAIEVEALDADGRGQGRFRVEFDESGRCVAMHPK